MRLGLLADIHGNVEKLQRAIELLRHEAVDQLVVLGDVIYDSSCSSQTVGLLQSCNAVGVWGNHDLGLCVDPEESLLTRFSPAVLEFFQSLNSTYECGDLLFSHTFPTQDPADPAAYYLGPRPHEQSAVDSTLEAFPHQRIFIGHFHRWFVGTSAGPLKWSADKPLQLEPNRRYVIVVHAVMNGWTAIYDDAAHLLRPIRL